MNYDLDPNVLRELPDETPMLVYVDPAVLNLRPSGGPRLASVSTTLGDVRRALAQEPQN